jgi:eukaryotic translation initiation factor 2C
MSVNLTELVKRPGAGSVGKPVRVRAKFFEVTNFTNGNIHHYDVTLDPPSTPPAVQRKVWKTFEDTDGQGILQGITTVYDGCKNVLSFKPLPLGEDNAMQFEVIYRLIIYWHSSKKKFFFLNTKINLSSF